MWNFYKGQDNLLFIKKIGICLTYTNTVQPYNIVHEWIYLKRKNRRSMVSKCYILLPVGIFQEKRWR